MDRPLDHDRYRRLVSEHGPARLDWHALGSVEDRRITFAVHLAETGGLPVFVRHRDRSTWELPGGRREPGERIEETGSRELREECGAVDPESRPIGLYSVLLAGRRTWGLLLHSRFEQMRGPARHLEIAEARALLRLDLPLSYPEIQGLILLKHRDLFPRFLGIDAAILSTIPDGDLR